LIACAILEFRQIFKLYIQSKVFIREEKHTFSGEEIMKEEYYYASYNNINSIAKQKVVDQPYRYLTFIM